MEGRVAFGFKHEQPEEFGIGLPLLVLGIVGLVVLLM